MHRDSGYYNNSDMAWYVVYWCSHGRQIMLEVQEDRYSDELYARLFMDGWGIIAMATWTECDGKRFDVRSDIPHCFAWIVDAMREEWGYNVPMELEV